jgi:hypothetical protein
MQPRKMLDWRKALIYTHRWAGIAQTDVKRQVSLTTLLSRERD